MAYDLDALERLCQMPKWKIGAEIADVLPELIADLRALRAAAETVLKEYNGALDYARIAPRDALMPMARAMLDLATALDAARRT